MTGPSDETGWQPAPFLRLSAALHAGAAVGAAFYPQHWPVAAAAVVADHVVLAAAGMWPRSRLLGPNLCRLPESAGTSVALTFDDGPDPEVTPRVLDRLEAAGARASFFCVGRHAATHPEIVREVAARGHRVENHSYTHRNGFAFHGPRRLGRDIDRAQALLSELAGAPPRWFRAPAGIRSPWLDPVLAGRGLRLASWTRRGFDAVARDPARVARRLLSGLSARDVLLLHDGTMLRRPPRARTVLDVLPVLLDAIAAAGLRPVALPAPEALA